MDMQNQVPVPEFTDEELGRAVRTNPQLLSQATIIASMMFVNEVRDGSDEG